MSNIDKQALREAAEKATSGKWERGDGNGNGGELHVYCDDALGSAVCEMTSEYNAIPKYQRINNLNFIAAANPATVLALLDELERKEEQRANWFQVAEKLGADLDAAERRIAEMEARDKPKFVQCWSCKHDIEVLAIADCDGYCPRCAAPIDLDDEPYAAAGKGE